MSAPAGMGIAANPDASVVPEAMRRPFFRMVTFAPVERRARRERACQYGEGIVGDVHGSPDVRHLHHEVIPDILRGIALIEVTPEDP